MEISSRQTASENDPSIEIDHKATAPENAVVRVVVSSDGLQAFINLEPPSNGGSEATLEAMTTALWENNITYKVDHEKLNSLVARPVYHLDILVSSGLAPVNGADGTATFLIKTEKTVLKPKANENGTVDYHDLGIVESVSKGQTLCIITPPTEGTPGISVQGKELPQRKGRPVPSYLGRNTELNGDGTAILSKINGQVEFDGRRIHVDETFCVYKNVDISTGNLLVNGNLVIQGMVLPGFILEAGGNIEIQGTVQNATIKAGGNIRLYSGITGSEVHCSGDFECRYIESSRIFTIGNIKAESIVNSDVKCGKSIQVAGKIAKIIGGSYIAGQNIEARSIGSRSNVKTKLELGTDQAVIERQQELLTQVSDLEAQNAKLNTLIPILQQLEVSNRLTPERKQAFDSAQNTYEANIRQLEAAKCELEEINQSIKAKGFGRILCSDTMYEGTQAIIGGASMAITDALRNVSLYYKDGQVCIGHIY